nr:hypothetical protein [uncultured Desulfobulbus sp.]
MSNDTMYDASRLIYLSLAYSSVKKRLLAQNKAEMNELLQRFLAEENFRRAVDAGLRAMDLRFLALEDGGLRLSAQNSESFFAANLTDYGRLLARGDLKAADVLSLHCAIATAVFPTEADLDMPVEDLGTITMEDVIAILRRFAHAEETLPEEDDRLHPQLRNVAQRLRELPEDNPDRVRAGAGQSWVDLAQQVIVHMIETGYLLVFEDPQGNTEYRPTPAYQTAMREGIVHAFHAFRDILTSVEYNEASLEAGEKIDVPTL